jgi:hypothetical protein
LSNPNDTVIYLPIGGSTQLDGMTVDDNNNLYVVEVTSAKIYKINLINQAYSVFVSSGVSSRPQDVIYDRNYNRLLVCSWYNNSSIQAVNISDSSITNLVNTTTGNCDGLAIDEKGNYYFSTWIDNSIYYYDTTFRNPPTLFSSGHSGPANLCYNKRNKVLAIPNFNSNSISFKSVLPTSINESISDQKNFSLFQNYPNPFNPVTTIRIEVGKSSHVNLELFDVLGNKVATLYKGEVKPGLLVVDFNSNLVKPQLTSGIYFYKLTTDGYLSTRKLMLLK